MESHHGRFWSKNGPHRRAKQSESCTALDVDISTLGSDKRENNVVSQKSWLDSCRLTVARVKYQETLAVRSRKLFVDSIRMNLKGVEKPVRKLFCKASSMPMHSSTLSKNIASYGFPGGWVPGWGRSTGEGNGNPLQCSCLRNLMDRGAWWLQSMESRKNETQLSD